MSHGKRLVIHVGTFKTGTSSLQNALASLPSDGDVLYPRSGLRTNEPETGIRHSPLVYSYTDDKVHYWRRLVDRLVREINESRSRLVVLSAEPWSRRKSHEGLQELVNLLASECGVTPEAVCYFRNRFGYARSLYREFTRVRGNRRPSQPYLRNVRDMFDYLALAESFAEIFRDQVSYYVIERVSDVVEHFFRHIGLPYQVRGGTLNRKCDALEAEVHRICNELGIKASQVDWRSTLQDLGIDLGRCFVERLPKDVLVSDDAYWHEFSRRTALPEEEVALLSREPDDDPRLLDVALIRPLLREVIMRAPVIQNAN